MTNSTNNISADISMNGQKLEEVTSFKYRSNPEQGWHLFARDPHHDCFSICQTKQDLAVQHHQLRKQVQAVEVSCHRHLPL